MPGMSRSLRPVSALAVLSALAVMLAVAPGASATIRPQVGMAGVQLHMTREQVRARLGPPRTVHHLRNDFGLVTQYLYPHAVRVTFQSGSRVTAIDTTGRHERTARGVGVGSSERTVRSKVAHVRCETIAGVRSCHVGAFRAGRRVTDFLIRRGRVVRVTVGFVID
jgi:hypothetical protein